MGKSFAPYCFDKISEAMAWCPQKALQSLRNKPKTLSLSSQKAGVVKMENTTD